MATVAVMWARPGCQNRNIILLPDTQRECVKAETMLVFQEERKNSCGGHKYVAWTVPQEGRGI